MASGRKKGNSCIWADEDDYLLQGATQVPVVHSVSFGYREAVETIVAPCHHKPWEVHQGGTGSHRETGKLHPLLRGH